MAVHKDRRTNLEIMPKISIPLNRNKTARRPRRAVWNSILSLVVLVVGCLFINFWFTRDTLAKSAPNNSKAEYYINITKKNYPILLKHFNHVPLIPDRAVTLKNLSPYLYGDIAVFSDTDSQSVVFKGNLTENTIASLSNYGLLVKQDKQNWVIQSSKATDTTPASKDNILTKIKSKFNDLELTLKLGQTEIEPSTGAIEHENTILSLQIPENTISTEMLPGLSSGASIIIKKTGQDAVDISIQINKVLNQSELIELHKQISSRLYPKTQTKELDDGTKMQELVYNPENIQQTELGNSVVYSTENLTTTVDSEKTVVSFEKQVADEASLQPSGVCLDDTVFFVNTNLVLWFLQNSSQTHLDNNYISQLLSPFVQIGLDKQGKYLQFHGCFQ